MAEDTKFSGTHDLIMAELQSKILMVSKESDHMFVINMAGNGANHGRCGQLLDKRITEFDLEEARAASAMDPMTTNYLLNQAIANQNSVHINSGVLLEILRATKK